jgi:hypothetical protein
MFIQLSHLWWKKLFVFSRISRIVILHLPLAAVVSPSSKEGGEEESLSENSKY